MDIAIVIAGDQSTMFKPSQTCYIVRYGSRYVADNMDIHTTTAQPYDAAIFYRMGAIRVAEQLGAGAQALMYTRSGKLLKVHEKA